MRVATALYLFLLLCSVTVIYARKRRRANEVHVINKSDQNLRIHCQSVKTDLHALFLDNGDDFKWNFYDIDRGNMHFWCDAYGLNDFFEQFDVFGEMAPLELNNTWILKPDGLYHDKSGLLERISTWMKPSTESVAHSL